VSTVAVAIPCHEVRARGGLLDEAIASVNAQTRLPDQLVVAYDDGTGGCGGTRNRALAGVTTDWVAFFDSDDVMYPPHLEKLLRKAERTGADLIYPWYDKPGVFDPHADREGKTFDERILRMGNFIPVPVLVRTEAVRAVGGFRGINGHEWEVWKAMLDQGAKFAHLPVRTWLWRCHPGQTQGALA
jgi:glycosyltransferase involved in cell wall biosynthesis